MTSNPVPDLVAVTTRHTAEGVVFVTAVGAGNDIHPSTVALSQAPALANHATQCNHEHNHGP